MWCVFTAEILHIYPKHKVMTLFSDVKRRALLSEKKRKAVICIFTMIYLKTAFEANDSVRYYNELTVEILPLNITCYAH